MYKFLNSLSSPSLTHLSSTKQLNLPFDQLLFSHNAFRFAVLWWGEPYQAMFKFARTIPLSVNCAVHVLLFLSINIVHEFSILFSALLACIDDHNYEYISFFST